MLLLRSYRIHSTRYRGVSVRAVPIPVITAVPSKNASLPLFSRGLTQYNCGNIRAAVL